MIQFTGCKEQEYTTNIDQAPEAMTGFSSPCGACKFLRRKCVSGCVFAPHFCHEQGAAHFAAIHKVFGASNASKLLMSLPATDRREAAVTISYEAQARLHDPVYGCVAHIFALQQQVVTLQAQLESLKTGAPQLVSSLEEDSIKAKIMAYEKGEARMPQLGESVKIESESYFGDDVMACTSMPYSQGYSSHIYTTDYTDSFNDDSINRSTMFPVDMQEYLQENGYY
ncbi:LOB domain-containing protein 11-like [Hordeum vulgare subsp. vulgare]|uniref:LOB domain-containing protein n=1 Tax=Hordeum vulgare subsp. vulgare TaxID=112509 RepID=A0A8I6WXS9_HORVV|nr:LOB domain-containing protein 11-like [Hordeum vulgare subsp. vulgare]